MAIEVEKQKEKEVEKTTNIFLISEEKGVDVDCIYKSRCKCGNVYIKYYIIL